MSREPLFKESSEKYLQPQLHNRSRTASHQVLWEVTGRPAGVPRHRAGEQKQTLGPEVGACAVQKSAEELQTITVVTLIHSVWAPGLTAASP